ncbi:MAG: DUF2809 domain-containing protein [Saprospiraceae bacterium]
MRQSRIFYTIAIFLTIPLGLLTRSSPDLFPDFIATYGGDTLWALLIYFIFRWLFVNKAFRFALIAAIGFSFFIEITQLYQGDWLNEIRKTLFGKLVLGSGFLWSDFICYTIGIFIGYFFDVFLSKKLKD